MFASNTIIPMNLVLVSSPGTSFAVGHTANHAIVLAQIYSQGKSHGVHPFVVQLRDVETHMPLPGIEIGEIGAKMGMHATNNGYLGFKQARIPRKNMLMKNNKVLEVRIKFTSFFKNTFLMSQRWL